jgi:hypothetical protein
VVGFPEEAGLLEETPEKEMEKATEKAKAVNPLAWFASKRLPKLKPTIIMWLRL